MGSSGQVLGNDEHAADQTNPDCVGDHRLSWAWRLQDYLVADAAGHTAVQPAEMCKALACQLYIMLYYIRLLVSKMLSNKLLSLTSGMQLKIST